PERVGTHLPAKSRRKPHTLRNAARPRVVAAKRRQAPQSECFHAWLPSWWFPSRGRLQQARLVPLTRGPSAWSQGIYIVTGISNGCIMMAWREAASQGKRNDFGEKLSRNRSTS